MVRFRLARIAESRFEPYRGARGQGDAAHSFGIYMARTADDVPGLTLRRPPLPRARPRPRTSADAGAGRGSRAGRRAAPPRSPPGPAGSPGPVPAFARPAWIPLSPHGRSLVPGPVAASGAKESKAMPSATCRSRRPPETASRVSPRTTHHSPYRDCRYIGARRPRGRRLRQRGDHEGLGLDDLRHRHLARRHASSVLQHCTYGGVGDISGLWQPRGG